MTKKYVSVKEAADYLNVSYRTLQRYLADGRITYTKPAGKIFIDIQALDNFILLKTR